MVFQHALDMVDTLRRTRPDGFTDMGSRYKVVHSEALIEAYAIGPVHSTTNSTTEIWVRASANEDAIYLSRLVADIPHLCSYVEQMAARINELEDTVKALEESKPCSATQNNDLLSRGARRSVSRAGNRRSSWERGLDNAAARRHNDSRRVQDGQEAVGGRQRDGARL